MEQIIYMFAALGMFFTCFTVFNFIDEKVKKHNANKPRNKEKDYLNGYDYLDKKDFMENYRFCSYCKSYWDSSEDYQCMCYSR